MSSSVGLLVDLSIIALLVLGIAQFRLPRGARLGNATAAAALLLAIGIVLYRHPVLTPGLTVAILLAGGAVGTLVAVRVTMIQIPAMVAFQHGMGGVAASAIAYVELSRAGVPVSLVAEVSGFLGLIIGAATFSGSMLASGKLAAWLKQTPTVLRGHNLLLVCLLLVAAVSSVVAANVEGVSLAVALVVAILASIVLGVAFAIRIGGADMPVLISFLNATAGLAAAFCGVAIGNRLLIACGATVAASGSILTAVMCQAMNRSFVKVLAGGAYAGATATGSAPPRAVPALHLARMAREAMVEAKKALREAGTVIVVPGYGMALAGAQFQVAELARRLEDLGKAVAFAIHPVAGRMPGHMNVLLAEADVDYEKLLEMDQVNDAFADTDAVIVVGACDVVNPAAIHTEGTPISGMPILNAHLAKRVLICNLDERPGYSGVPNSLYDEPKTLMLLGDAKSTVTELLESLPRRVPMEEAVA